MKLNPIYLFVFLLSLSSCSKESLTRENYVKWVEDEANGLNVSKEMDKFTFSLQYKPSDYIALRENRGATEKEVQSRKEQLGNMLYYTLTIKSKERKEMLMSALQSEGEYYERLNYFTGIAQEDMNLVEGNDTIGCVLYHLERNYNIAAYNKIVLGFEDIHTDKKKREDLVFQFNDRVLGIGPVKIKIKREDLDNIPILKL